MWNVDPFVGRPRAWDSGYAVHDVTILVQFFSFSIKVIENHLTFVFLYFFSRKGTLTDAGDGDGGGTIFYLIPKFKIRPRQRPDFEFRIVLSINTYLISC